jgi:hypothetical protein
VLELEPSVERDLLGRAVTVEPTAIVWVDGHAEVVLADGCRLAFDGLFTTPRDAPSSPLARQMECELITTPTGTQIATDAAKETSGPGV